MDLRNNKIIGFFLGLIIIIFSFMVVFGKDLPNLFIENDSDNVPSVGDPSTLKPTTNGSSSVTTTVVKPSTKPVSQKPSPSGGSSSSSSSPKAYTLTEVSTHNSATSCWSAINGEVYDLTTWVDRHPGGRMTILMICGKDGSPLFNAQHGGQSRPGSILASYKIASLK